ncbi:MAG: hypothetical protein DRP09_18735, partial [Candidatus Thorarchaeota archaeon]
MLKIKKAVIISFLIILSVFIITNLYGTISGYAVNSVQSSISIDPGIVVRYSNFNGNTTDFLYLNDSELSRISNLTLERSPYGKVVFQETINLTQDTDN